MSEYDFFVGKFTTIPLEKTNNEVGYFEYDLIIPLQKIERQASKRDFLMHEIAAKLTELCARHGTPRELWDFTPSPRVRALTQLPENIPFR